MTDHNTPSFLTGAAEAADMLGVLSDLGEDSPRDDAWPWQWPWQWPWPWPDWSAVAEDMRAAFVGLHSNRRTDCGTR